MPTKTFSLSDESYHLIMEQPKGNASFFVDEAIKAVTFSQKEQVLHLLKMRNTEVEHGLKKCFIGKHKRFSQKEFFEFMYTTFLKAPEGKGEEYLKGWLFDE